MKINLIFYNLNPSNQLISQAQEFYGRPSSPYELKFFTDSKETEAFLKSQEFSIVLFSIESKSDLVNVMGIMKACGKLVKAGKTKFSGFNSFPNPNIESALAKLGVQEILPITVKPKTLQFKIDFWSKSIWKELKDHGKREDFSFDRKVTSNQTNLKNEVNEPKIKKEKGGKNLASPSSHRISGKSRTDYLSKYYNAKSSWKHLTESKYVPRNRIEDKHTYLKINSSYSPIPINTKTGKPYKNYRSDYENLARASLIEDIPAFENFSLDSISDSNNDYEGNLDIESLNGIDTFGSQSTQLPTDLLPGNFDMIEEDLAFDQDFKIEAYDPSFDDPSLNLTDDTMINDEFSDSEKLERFENFGSFKNSQATGDTLNYDQLKIKKNNLTANPEKFVENDGFFSEDVQDVDTFKNDLFENGFDEDTLSNLAELEASVANLSALGSVNLQSAEFHVAVVRRLFNPDGKVSFSQSIAEFQDYFDDNLTLITHQIFAVNENVGILLTFKYKEEVTLRAQGFVASNEPAHDGQHVLTVNLKNHDKQKLEQILNLHQERQENIQHFLKMAKGK
jgi:hypothetical protein